MVCTQQHLLHPPTVPSESSGCQLSPLGPRCRSCPSWQMLPTLTPQVDFEPSVSHYVPASGIGPEQILLYHQQSLMVLNLGCDLLIFSFLSLGDFPWNVNTDRLSLAVWLLCGWCPLCIFQMSVLLPLPVHIPPPGHFPGYPLKST